MTRVLPLPDRFRLLSRLEHAWEEGTSSLLAPLDRRADEWLTGWEQSPRARERAWEPLSRFLFGEGLFAVSARAFVRTLHRYLLSRRGGWHTLAPPTGLREAFLAPLLVRLQRLGVCWTVNCSAIRMRVNATDIAGVQLDDGTVAAADWYVATVPPWRLTPLLPERIVARYAYFQQLLALRPSRIVTVSLIVDRLLTTRLLLLSRRPFHWLHQHPMPRDGRTYLSLVIAGATERDECPDNVVQEVAMAEFRRWGAVPDGAPYAPPTILRNEAARLRLSPASCSLRPLPLSPCTNLFLAGDWADTGLPSGLEGAVVSGEQCAEALLSQLRSKRGSSLPNRLLPSHR